MFAEVGKTNASQQIKKERHLVDAAPATLRVPAHEGVKSGSLGYAHSKFFIQIGRILAVLITPSDTR